MRYCYHNKAYLNSGAKHGIFCNPVLRDKKVIRGRGNQLVVFQDGKTAVVVARALRLKSKCIKHREV